MAGLLLIAGLGQGGRVWRGVTAHLARPAITYDNRGTGSAPGPARATVAELADDAAEAAGGAVDVAGLSMGGYVALTLALARAELVRSLVLVGTGAGGADRVPRTSDVRDAFREAFLTLSPEEYMRRVFPYTVRPDRVGALIDENVAHAAPHRTTAAHTRACLGFYRQGVEVERITAPALVVHGSDDQIVPVENGRRLAERLPNAEYVELPGHGHDLAQEAPGELAALIEGFLS